MLLGIPFHQGLFNNLTVLLLTPCRYSWSLWSGIYLSWIVLSVMLWNGLRADELSKGTHRWSVCGLMAERRGREAGVVPGHGVRFEQLQRAGRPLTPPAATTSVSKTPKVPCFSGETSHIFNGALRSTLSIWPPLLKGCIEVRIILNNMSSRIINLRNTI